MERTPQQDAEVRAFIENEYPGGMVREFLTRMFNTDSQIKAIYDLFEEAKEEIIGSDCYARNLPEYSTGNLSVWSGHVDRLVLRILDYETAVTMRVNRLRNRADDVTECLEYIPPNQKQLILDYYSNLSSDSIELAEAEFNLMVEIEWIQNADEYTCFSANTEDMENDFERILLEMGV